VSLISVLGVNISFGHFFPYCNFNTTWSLEHSVLRTTIPIKQKQTHTRHEARQPETLDITMILLKAGGARTVVEEDEAIEFRDRFKDELARFGECHTLNLSCRAWRLKSLKILEPVLLQIKATVRVLLIDDIIASLNTEEGLACLGFIAGLFTDATQLTRVNLNDNAIGCRGIQCIRPLLQNSNIVSFSLENCGLSESDGADLGDLLTTACVGRKLRELSLSRNQMGAGGASHIGNLLENERNSGLHLFSYAGSRPLTAGTKALCKGLAKMAHHCGVHGTLLQTLDLNDCCVGSDDGDPIVDLCYTLRNSPRLQKLILRDGELNVAGLSMVLGALQESGAPITVLDLGAIGELGKDGGRVIRDYLLSNGPASISLQELYLDTNELGDEGVAEILTGIAASCRSLRVLDLSENELVHVTKLFCKNHITSLQKLKLEDNSELEAGNELQLLRGMYREVLVDEELDHIGSEGNEEAADDFDNSVDALADMLDLTQLK
jgi:Ran GTPase-activating protein (RanGAP) involved in mRNA processing and transport